MRNTLFEFPQDGQISQLFHWKSQREQQMNDNASENRPFFSRTIHCLVTTPHEICKQFHRPQSQKKLNWFIGERRRTLKEWSNEIWQMHYIKFQLNACSINISAAFVRCVLAITKFHCLRSDVCLPFLVENLSFTPIREETKRFQSFCNFLAYQNSRTFNKC